MFEFTVLDMCGLAKLLIVSIPTKFATGYFLKTLYSLYLLPVLILHYGRSNVCTVLVVQEMMTPLSDPRHTKAGGKFTPQICRNHKAAIAPRHPKTLYSLCLLPVFILHYRRPSVCTVRVMSEMLTPLSYPRHTKAVGNHES